MHFCALLKNSRLPKKWWENNFWEVSQVYPADALWVKFFLIFVEIPLSCTASKINAFLHFTQIVIVKIALSDTISELNAKN